MHDNFNGSKPSIEVEKSSKRGYGIKFNSEALERIKRNGAWGSTYDSGEIIISINEPRLQ